MDKRVITYLAAGLLAALGAGLLLFSVMSDSDSEPEASDQTVSAEAEVTDTFDADAEDGDENAADDQDDKAGTESRVSLAAGPVLIAAAPAPAVEIPEEFVQVSFALSTERTFAGQFRPGDHVGIMASFSEDGVGFTDLILQKILVSAIREEAPLPIDQGDFDRLPAAPLGRFFITLALSADDAESLTNGLEFGSIWLIEQSEDAGEDAPGVESFHSIVTDEIVVPDSGSDPAESDLINDGI